MRKKITIILFILLCFVFIEKNSAFAEGGNSVAVGINDHLLEFKNQKPIMINYTVYSPIEPLLKGLKSKYTYDALNSLYIVENKDEKISISLESKTITLSDKRTVNNQIKSINGQSYISVRLISELLGYEVKYLKEHRVVRVLNSNHKYKDENFLSINRKQLDEFYNPSIKKVVYLTFDDGPNQYTSQVLDILKKKNAHATFFMIGQNMKNYKEVINRMLDEGNYPGLHSMSHDRNKLYKSSPQNVANEMEQARKTLLAISEFDSRLTRVPYGSKPYMSEDFRVSLYEKQFKMWDWNIDTQDWKYGTSDTRKIVAKVKNGLKEIEGKKQPIVILFHDSKGTVKVLPEIIDFLRQKGYEPIAYNPANHVVVNYWGDKRL